MSKIRINELARQLEVKSREVIDKLHELGIAEKVTHSSSIDEDKAETLRRYYRGEDISSAVAASRNGAAVVVDETDKTERETEAKEARREEVETRQKSAARDRVVARPTPAPAEEP